MAEGDDGTQTGPGGDDPFSGLELDQRFVSAAPVHEGSAEERGRRARIVADLDRQRVIRLERDRAARKARARERRRHWRSWTLMSLVAVAVGAWLWSTANSLGSPSGSAWGTSTDTFVHDSSISAYPPRADDAGDTPLGTPLQVTPSPHHIFATFQPGSTDPVAYDPCRPIRVVVNPRTSPQEGPALVDAALAEVSRVSGLQFIVEDVTDEAPTHPRSPVQKDRYGDRWAPVLIAWSDPTESDHLAGDVAGVAGSQAISRGSDELIYVTGTVALDGPQFEELLGHPDGYAAAQAVVLHELGHLVGLDHIDVATELMHPEGRAGISTFGPGDLTGLAALGRGVCRSDI